MASGQVVLSHSLEKQVKALIGCHEHHTLIFRQMAHAITCSGHLFNAQLLLLDRYTLLFSFTHTNQRLNALRD